MNPRNTILSLKYGQDNLMLWESFSGNEAGCLFKIFRTMIKEEYFGVLKENLKDTDSYLLEDDERWIQRWYD